MEIMHGEKQIKNYQPMQPNCVQTGVHKGAIHPTYSVPFLRDSPLGSANGGRICPIKRESGESESQLQHRKCEADIECHAEAYRLQKQNNKCSTCLLCVLGVFSRRDQLVAAYGQHMEETRAD